MHVDTKEVSGSDVVTGMLSYLIIWRFGDLRQVEKWLQLCTGGNLVKQGNVHYVDDTDAHFSANVTYAMYDVLLSAVSRLLLRMSD